MPACVLVRRDRLIGQGAHLDGAALGRPPGFGRDAESDAVQPTSHGLTLIDGASLAYQHEKGCLKGVLGVLLVPQHTPAYAQHQASITPHQRCERGLVPERDKAIE
jgi:hypothetical protein